MKIPKNSAGRKIFIKNINQFQHLDKFKYLHLGIPASIDYRDWTPQRVRAHIAICYMAFCCLQHLRKRLKMLGHPMSPSRTRKELNAVQVSILRRKGTRERYAMPSPVTTNAKRILTCVGLTWNEAPF